MLMTLWLKGSKKSDKSGLSSYLVLNSQNSESTIYYVLDRILIAFSRQWWRLKLSEKKRKDFYFNEMSKRPIRTLSLSLKCAELRCKKSLRWQTYSLLTNQSEDNDERKKRLNNSPQRAYSTKMTLGTLSDCKITITIIKYGVWFSCSVCGHRFHQILNLGDKMRYCVLGRYGSPYRKLMTRFIID